MERVARKLARSYRYNEIRTPLLEETRLFSRSLGETSDVVEKEMFTVPPRAEGSSGHTLRPEGTASSVRAYVQGGYPSSNPFQKWFYLGPMFRYERPQKGRERQFTQFGVEAFGSQSPHLDAEVVDLAMRFFEELGFGDSLEVRVNTMGDPDDRARWRTALQEFFAERMEGRCADCKARLERNVFRLLDCKVAACQEANEGSPPLAELMGEESSQHHAEFLSALQALGRQPVEDPSIVRGLDYYARSVFEIHYPPLGARSALCGGGRYDGLVEEIGGPPTPAVGFAIGFTPAELAMRALNLPSEEVLDELRATLRPRVYCVAMTAEDREQTFALAGQLRAAGLEGVELDFRGKSAKAQLKEAAKSNVALAVLLGPDERANQRVVLRDMQSREEQTLPQEELVHEVTRLLGQ